MRSSTTLAPGACVVPATKPAVAKLYREADDEAGLGLG
jgi:hypothetical protein